MNNKKENIYKAWGSFLVRKAQKELSERGITPTDDTVRDYLRKNYPKEKKSKLQKYGIPQ